MSLIHLFTAGFSANVPEHETTARDNALINKIHLVKNSFESGRTQYREN